MPHDLEVIARECEGGSEYPPLLFVHGSCHAAWCWDEHFLGFFAERGFDAYALSLRGHGNSGGGEAAALDLRGRLRGGCRAGGLGPCRPSPVVIGHSLGGFIVQKYLERHDPPGAVLVAPAPRRGMLRTSVRWSLRDPWPFLKFWLTLEPYVLFSTPERCHRLFFSPDMDEETVRRYWSRLGRESFRSWLEMLGRPPDAGRIRGTPMLMLGAAADRLIPEAALRDTAEDYGAELVMLPDMAHDLMLETRWRDAAGAMEEWLLRTLAPSPARP